MSECVGYAEPYADKISEAMRLLNAQWYKAHNAPVEAMKFNPKNYDSFRLVFKAPHHTWEDAKQTLINCGLPARTVSKAFDSDGLMLRECRIEIQKPVTTKKLNKRDLAKALKQSERDGQKFAVRFN